MEQGLEGIRVVELAQGMAASVAGKLMADLGATVLKVEPPGGDPMRHEGPFPGGRPGAESGGLFAALHAGKRSAVLDLSTEEGRARLAELAVRADILLHDYPPPRMAAAGLDYTRFSAANPRLVMLSITPFGQGGPYRDYAATDLTVIHGGGWAWLSPTASADTALPPLAPFGQNALIMAGVHGAVAALGAYTGALTHGRGEHIDLSAQEVVLSMLEMNLIRYTYQGLEASRVGIHLFGPWGFYPCQDGVIFLVVAEEDQWQRLKEFMGRPEWAELEVFGDIYLRGENADFLDRNLSEWTAEWKVMELFHACQQRRICVAPVSTYGQLAAEPHLRERGFFVEHEHPRLGKLTLPGAPWRLGKPWWALRGPAPELDEAKGALDGVLPARKVAPAANATATATITADGRAPLPLEGVRVLDLTWVWAGPYCTMQLAHLGAEVIKVESVLRPDLARRIRIYPEGMEEGLNRAGYFNQYSQGKKSVRVNLAKREGVELIKRLARHCDVVVNNYATGVTERLGLTPEILHEVNPELIVASISGYGQTGPLREYMGYGPAIVPLGGLTSITGYDDGAPREVGISYGDPNGGIYTAYAICAALAARKRNGGGQTIELSLWEAMLCSGIEGWMGHLLDAGYRPMGNRDPRWAPHNVYRCAGEDRWIALAVTDDAQWRGLCEAIGRPALADDPRFHDLAARKTHEDELDALLAEWIAPLERWEATRRLQAAGVPAFPSMSNKDLTEDPHLAERQYFTRLTHPEVGVRTHGGIPWRLAHGPNGVRSPAPLLGAHTDEIMANLLELPPAEIARLKKNQVLA